MLHIWSQYIDYFYTTSLKSLAFSPSVPSVLLTVPKPVSNLGSKMHEANNLKISEDELIVTMYSNCRNWNYKL